jgi:hypothetical protein
MFAVQPAIYHPDDSVERDDRIVFAGSYGESHFPERRAALELLLDAAAGLDLRIFDRNAGQPRSDKSFPPRFAPHLRGALDYPALADEYRRAAVCLNVNSVTDSPTMFSRRVFEMLACGACVVSTPSTGIDAVFGDLVPTVDTVGAARAAIRRLIDDAAHRAATSARGIREVMLHHTYEHRLREVTAALGLTVPTRAGLAVLAIVHSPAEAQRLVTLLETQTHGPTHVAVALRDMDDTALDQARTTLVSALTGHRTVTITDTRDFGTELMATRQLAADLRPTWVAPFHLARDYGPDHLADLAARSRYTTTDHHSHHHRPRHPRQRPRADHPPRHPRLVHRPAREPDPRGRLQARRNQPLTDQCPPAASPELLPDLPVVRQLRRKRHVQRGARRELIGAADVPPKQLNLSFRQHLPQTNLELLIERRHWIPFDLCDHDGRIGEVSTTLLVFGREGLAPWGLVNLQNWRRGPLKDAPRVGSAIQRPMALSLPPFRSAPAPVEVERPGAQTRKTRTRRRCTCGKLPSAAPRAPHAGAPRTRRS